MEYELHVRNQDIDFDMPDEWDNCAFLGNGTLGALPYHLNGESFIIRLGHTGVYDNRPKDLTVNGKMFQTPRLPVGFFELKTKGKIVSSRQKLSLFDAEATGTITTDCGRIEYVGYVASTKDFGCFRFNGFDGEADIAVTYVAEKAESPRQTKMRNINDMNRFNHNYPEPKAPYTVHDECEIFVQPKFTVGAYSVAYSINDGKLIWTVQQNDNTDTLISESKSIILDAIKNECKFRSGHKEWWNSYFGRTFLSMNDKRYESFYYAQLYKIASATRENGRIIDTVGPWLTTTSWPAAFWNLNTQLTYAAMYAPCLFDMASSLPNTLMKEYDILVSNVDEQYRDDCIGIGSNTTADLSAPVAVPGRDTKGYVELGNLPWTLYDIYLQYKYTLDINLIKDTVYPLLKRCLNYYNNFLIPDENNVLHLMPTASPEYGVVGPDCNYDLALIRFSCLALKDCVRILGISDEKEALWDDILSRLTPYPEYGDEGFMINANQRMDKSHRHYSHLLMAYPLHLLDIDNPEDADKIRRSVEHWHSMPEALQGYSQTGACAMYAMLGDGEKALHYLSDLWNKGFVSPSTMYKEDGGAVLETPIAAMNSLLDMLLATYDGILRIFPAVPKEWSDICFKDLAGVGAFRISAEYKDSAVKSVKIKSLNGSVCKVQVPFRNPEKVTCNGCDFTFDGKFFTLQLSAGCEAILTQ